VGGSEQLALFDLSGDSPGHAVEPFPAELAASVPSGGAVSATVSARGETVLLLLGSRVWVWDRSATGGGAEPVPAVSAGLPVSAAVSPDGSILAVASLDFATVFDAATLAVTGRLSAPRAPNLAISPDNRLLAIADIAYPLTPTLDLHDLQTGERTSVVGDLTAVTGDVDPLRGAWVSSLSFSSDGRRFAAANHRGAAMIWDTTTMEPIGEPVSRGGGGVLDLEFAGSGDRLALISASNEITVIDVATREPVERPMQSPSGLSIGLAVSPDGASLLSGGSDGIQLWDVRSGTSIGRPYPVPTPLGPPMLWLDTETFAVVTDRGLETWTIDPVQWRAHVCELAGRSLTDGEWASFGTEAPTPRC
jgi:WD40 repeat protein